MNISAKMLIERILEFGEAGYKGKRRRYAIPWHCSFVGKEGRKTHTVIIDVKFVWSSWTWRQ